MNVTRREVISGLVCAAVPVGTARGRPPVETVGSLGAHAPIGIQAWSIRDALNADAAGTLKRIADIGFRQVEFFDIATTEPAIRLCHGLGLDTISLHFWDIFAEDGSWAKWNSAGRPATIPSFDPDKQAADAARYGFRTMVFSGDAPDEACSDPAAASVYCDVIGRVGAALRKRGLRFLYHPHVAEFRDLGDGRALYDMLVDRTDPADVGIEADMFWFAHAGRDPVAAVRKLGARAEMLHIKDRRRGAPPGRLAEGYPEDKTLFVPVGTGSIDFPAVVKAARIAGVRNLTIEQDESQVDPVVDAGRSYTYLRGLLAA